eukprot:Hpha_TRINITY_DN15647_c1_g1::TRINITY_DN15647_c1_g1_i1::g.101178::m.101178
MSLSLSFMALGLKVRVTSMRGCHWSRGGGVGAGEQKHRHNNETKEIKRNNKKKKIKRNSIGNEVLYDARGPHRGARMGEGVIPGQNQQEGGSGGGGGPHRGARFREECSPPGKLPGQGGGGGGGKCFERPNRGEKNPPK